MLVAFIFSDLKLLLLSHFAKLKKFADTTICGGDNSPISTRWVVNSGSDFVHILFFGVLQVSPKMLLNCKNRGFSKQILSNF